MSLSKKNLVRGLVTMATAGLSTCIDNGAVDPAPPPLECNDVGDGQSLSASATLEGTTLTVRIASSADATWGESSDATDLVNLTLTGTPTIESGEVVLVFELAPADATTASFAFSSSLVGWDGGSCPVKRKFTVTIDGADIKVAIARPRGELPLARRDVAAILVAGREGREIDLETLAEGGRVEWSVTGGELSERGPGKMRWRLPEAPGLYQAELVVDRGRAGLSIDTLTLEVT